MNQAPNIVGLLFGFVFLAGVIMLYFLPTFVGRKKKNSTAIFVLNLFLGWTFLGWVIALVWAVSHEDRPAKPPTFGAHWPNR